MTAGLQIFNADGSLQMDIGSRTLRLITALDVSTATGSTTQPNLSTGVALVGVIPVDYMKKTPTITRSGNTVSWDFTGIPVGERDYSARMIVAVY